MKIIERKLQEIGQSLLVTLPKEWTQGLKLKKGSNIKIIITEQGQLLIAPEFTQKEEKKEITITYKENFERDFLKYYFKGYDQINIIIKEKSKAELYNFLKRFINVQIIEEQESKIILKSFKIEDLSIEECYKRMVYISLSILEKKLTKNNINQELRESQTKFYYMLIMQVRRFLEEGKFTKENQIPLVRSLDFRMASEKIQKISYLIEQLEFENKILPKIKELYTKTSFNFITQDYEKSLTNLTEINQEIKIISKQLSSTKILKEYKNLRTYNDILDNIKSICKLIK